MLFPVQTQLPGQRPPPGSQVDKDNPLSYRLRYACPFYEGGPTLVNYARPDMGGGAPQIPANTAGPMAAGVSFDPNFGMVCGLANGTVNVNGTRPAINDVPDTSFTLASGVVSGWSILVRARSNDSGQTLRGLFGSALVGGGDQATEMYVEANTGVMKFDIWYRPAGSDVKAITGTKTILPFVYYNYLVIGRYAVAGAQNLETLTYIDGQQDGYNNLGSIGSGMANTQVQRIGGAGTFPSANWLGNIDLFLFWNYALPDQLAKTVSADPWQLFRPKPTRNWWTGFGVATGITFDTTSNSGYQAAASTYSWSHTCTGSNRFLAVDVALLSAGSTVTGITYNSVALSLIGAQTTVTSFGRVECWGLIAPASGSNTIAVTLSGAIASSSEAVSYTNVNQTTATEAFNSAQATNVGAADATVTITTVADQDWVHAAIATGDSSITAGQTTRNNVTGAGGSGADEDTGAPVAATTAQAMTYTGVGAAMTWAIAGYAIRPTSASGSTSYSRTTTDATTLSESLSRAGIFYRTTTESLSSSESLARAGVFARTLTDSITFSAETATRAGVFARATTDSASLSESLVRAGVFSRTNTDALSSSGVVTRTGVFARAATDAIASSESLARAGTFTRTTSDSLTISESLARAGVFSRTATASLTSSESLNRAGVFSRTSSDSLSSSDSITRTVLEPRACTDTLTVSESVARVGVFSRTLTDVLSNSEAVNRVASEVRTTIDSLTSSDIVTRAGVFARTVTDAATSSENVTRVEILARATTETLTVSEAATRLGIFTRALTDAVTLSESLARVGVFSRTNSNTLTSSEDVTQLSGKVAFVTESLVSSESVSATKALIRTTTDTGTLAESTSRVADKTRTLTDAITTSESVSRTTPKTRTTVDSVTLADTVTSQKLVFRTTTESLTTDEVVIRAGNFTRTITDTIISADVGSSVIIGVVSTGRNFRCDGSILIFNQSGSNLVFTCGGSPPQFMCNGTNGDATI